MTIEFQRNWRHLWQRIRRPLAWLFLAGVAALIVRHGMTIDWREVLRAMQRFELHTLLLAAACAGASHLVYACTDLFARRIIAGRVSRARSLAITFVCYAFNLNLGSWVGSIGFRYRLYTRFGLRAEEITRVIGMSLATNWSGYLLLAGAVFAFGVLRLPPSWELGSLGLRLIGSGMLAALAAGLALTAFSRKRTWTLFGRSGRLPTLRKVLLQLLVSSINWLLIAGILFVLLRPHFDYPTVLAVFLLAAIAGAAAHIPAGLGVIEGVFLALLGGQAPHSDLLAALFAFRAIYYLVPLLIAFVVYLLLETEAKAAAGTGPPARAPDTIQRSV